MQDSSLKIQEQQLPRKGDFCDLYTDEDSKTQEDRINHKQSLPTTKYIKTNPN